MEKIKTSELPEVFEFDGNTYVIVDDGHTRRISALNLLNYNFLKNKPKINGQVLRDDITLNVGLFAHRLSVRDNDRNYFYFTLLSPSRDVITKEILLNSVKGGNSCALADNELIIEDVDSNFRYFTLHKVAYASGVGNIRLDIVQNYNNGAEMWNRVVSVSSVMDTVYTVV